MEIKVKKEVTVIFPDGEWRELLHLLRRIAIGKATFPVDAVVAANYVNEMEGGAGLI